MERSVHLFAHVRIPYEEARRLLCQDPGLVLRPAWEEAAGSAADPCGIRPGLEVHGLEEEIAVRRCRIHFGCSGLRSGVLTAGIEVSEVSPGETRVALLCRHPLSFDGASAEPERRAREALQGLFRGSVRRLEIMLRPAAVAGEPAGVGARA